MRTARAPEADSARARVPLAVGVALVLFAGCAPALDWREFVPEGFGVRVRFPCRPDRVVREAPFAATTTLPVTMLSCSAEGQTFALGMAAVPDPAQVTPVLRAWRESVGRRVDGARVVAVLVSVPGATANPAGGGLEIDGHLPDGRAVAQRLLFFVRDRRVFQAAVVGETVDDVAVGNFFDGLRAGD